MQSDCYLDWHIVFIPQDLWEKGGLFKRLLTIKLPLSPRAYNSYSSVSPAYISSSCFPSIAVMAVWMFHPSHISAFAGSLRGASDGVFGYVNSHRQTLLRTSAGSKGERVFAFRELAEMYILVADGGIARCVQEGVRTHEIVACCTRLK
jgi:hypothetical protein